MIDLYPKKCNLCGSKVEYIENAKIYGRSYGSGYCYHCTECGAYVGTHRCRPKEAMGILADAEMRKLKMECHALFDPMWGRGDGGRHRKRRNRLYSLLAGQMGIPVAECHFGYFDMEQLQKAYEILSSGQLREAAG